MSEEQRREFGRDGVSGLVSRDRALRAKLLPRREIPREEKPRTDQPLQAIDREHRNTDRPGR